METTHLENFCESTGPKNWLLNLLAEKGRQNPKFSLRAFSRMVEISPAVLSRVLTGKRKLTFNLAVRIADALLLNPYERETLYSFYLTQNYPDTELENMRREKEFNLDCFHAMKEWYHYGITQLLYIDTFNDDPKWIAKMLSITELEAKLAVDRLIRLKILNRDENGKMYKTAAHLSTSTDIATSGIRHFQKQILEKAINSLMNDDISERDITSITIAINESKIKEVKKEIKKFRMKMSEFMSEGEKTRVYNLGIHLIPLSQSSHPKKNEK